MKYTKCFKCNIPITSYSFKIKDKMVQAYCGRCKTKVKVDPEIHGYMVKSWKERKRCAYFVGLQRIDFFKTRPEKETKTSSLYEKQFIKQMEEDGWEVLNKGWPDFICLKENEIKIVEVKSKTDLLTNSQKRILKILATKFQTYVYKNKKLTRIPKYLRQIKSLK